MSDIVVPERTVRQQVLELIRLFPGITVTELLEKVTGKSGWRPQVNAACLDLLDAGIIKRKNIDRKNNNGNTFHYYVAESESLVFSESRRPWESEEILGAVNSYWNMLQKELRGEIYNKREAVRELQAGALKGRSHSSIEYRMRNISAVLESIGHAQIQGYRPAKNVGEAPTRQILAFWAELDTALPDVLRELPKPSRTPPTGNSSPQRTRTTTTTHQRDSKVVAWTLERAAGFCEYCQRPAPFTLADGRPYLEVHHVHALADKGEDTPSNAVALCPNCHREAHYGAAAARMVSELRAYLGELFPATQD